MSCLLLQGILRLRSGITDRDWYVSSVRSSFSSSKGSCKEDDHDMCAYLLV